MLQKEVSRMAKSRKTIGSIVKGRDGKPDYIKVNVDVVLKQGQFLNLESQQYQLASLDKAVADGKIKEDTAEQVRERINKLPAFVRFEITTYEEK